MTYTRVKELGRGQFGIVFLEHDDALNRPCAVKYINPAYLVPGREFDEARIMIGAEHDHVVRVYSADFEQGVAAIRMEYLAHGSVEAKHNGHPIPVTDATRILEDAARGVAVLHAQQVLHRDIKPGNLLIADNGAIKVSDFGLARRLNDPQSGLPFAYPPHLPPEAVISGQGIETETGDVYALGVTAYRLYNGDAMLDSAIPPGTTDLSQLIIRGRYPDTRKMQPYIHKALRRVMTKALHRDPNERYQTATEFRHALEAARPLVSWGLDPNRPDAWIGTGSNGRTYHAAITNNGVTAAFTVKKSTNGGASRNVSTDALAGTHAAVARHAAEMMQRYAARGS